MASYEKGKYQYTDGSVIYYNEAETSDAFKQISKICGEVSEYSKAVLDSDKCFDGFPQQYADLFPTPRYSAIVRGIDANLSGIQRTVCEKMGRVINAIIDYCNGGGFSDASQKTLDTLLSSMPPTTSPNGGDGGDGSDGGDYGAGGNDDGLSGDDVLEPSDPETTIPVGVGLGDDLNSVDEKVVIPEIAGSNSSSSGTGVVIPSTDKFVNETIDDTLENSSDVAGSSLSGFSSFIVPSSNKDEIRKPKSAGVLGSIGLAAAAAIALGAKIYRDKSDDENEEELIMEDLDGDFSNNIPSSNNKDMLKMKKKIFKIGVDE